MATSKKIYPEIQKASRGGVTVFMDISERKRTEEALKNSQERLVLAQKVGKIGTCEWNFQTRRLIWTEELEALYGLAPGGFDGNYETWLQMLHPDDRNKINRSALTALAAGTDLDIEFRIVLPDGGLRWVSAKTAISRDDEGTLHRLVCVNMDITDHKQIQEQLIKSEEQLLLAVEGADLGMWDYDLLSGELHWSKRCKTIFGFAPDAKVTNDLFMEAVYPQDRQGLERAMQRSIANRQDYDIEYRILKADRTIHWVAALGRAYYGKHGSGQGIPTRITGVMLDITDRKQAEDERDRLLYQEQEARKLAEFNMRRIYQLQALTASLAQALTVADVTNILLNQGLAAFNAKRGWIAHYIAEGQIVEITGTHGYQEDELVPYRHVSLTASLPLTDAIRTGQMVVVQSPDEYRTRYPHIAESHIASGTQSLVAIPLILDEHVIGSFGLSLATPRHFDASDRSFMMTVAQQCAQALERARLYESERMARESAEAANRIKDEFLAVLSHELRSPLNPILGWSKLLRSRPFDEASRDRALEIIERNAKLQAQLIEDLLDVSRILRGKLNLDIVPVNLVIPIQGAIETVRLAAEAKSLQIQMQLNPNVGKVLGDASRLQQIVWNLLSNAVKFTPVGGQITISLEQAEQRNTEGSSAHHATNFDFSSTCRFAHIQVSDTGQGIDPGFLPHVFEHFRQADSTTTRKFGGLGLGLAIVRHLVELHGGTVWAESQGENQGAVFTVRLPMLKDESEGVKDEISEVSSFIPLSSSLLSGVQILVVDDELDAREYVSFALEQMGAVVTIVTSAEEALTALVTTKPDVLLSDVGMPNADGYMLLQHIRALPPEQGGQIPAIALTAYASEHNRQQAIAAGFQRHISKPVEPEQLSRAIADLISR